MRFALVNMLPDRSEVPDLTLAQVADALERQSFEHVSPFCEQAGCTFEVAQDLATVPENVVPLCVLLDADQAGELGVHDQVGGRPVGKAFWGPLKANGGTLVAGGLSLSCTLSHEATEITNDPYCCYWIDKGGGILVALESADPCEDQWYNLDGIAVSDFVGPRWGRVGPGPFNWLQTMTQAFEVTSGGYVISESITITSGLVNDVDGAKRYGEEATRVRRVHFGPAVPEWKKALKREKSRTRIRLAA